MISNKIVLALVASLAFAGSAVAAPDNGVVDCLGGGAEQVKRIVEGEPFMPYACEWEFASGGYLPVATAGPDGIVDCVKGGVGALATALLEGHYEPYACNLNDEGVLTPAGGDGIVDCATGTAGAVVRAVEGYPQPYHCDLSGDDPTGGVVDCVKGGAEQLARALLGEPYMPYPCEF